MQDKVKYNIISLNIFWWNMKLDNAYLQKHSTIIMIKLWVVISTFILNIMIEPLGGTWQKIGQQLKNNLDSYYPLTLIYYIWYVKLKS